MLAASIISTMEMGCKSAHFAALDISFIKGTVIQLVRMGFLDMLRLKPV